MIYIAWIKRGLSARNTRNTQNDLERCLLILQVHMDDLHRTNTRFPGSPNSSPGKRHAVADVETSAKRRENGSSRLSLATDVPIPPKFLENRQRFRPPAAIPLQVNPSSQQYAANPRPRKGRAQQVKQSTFIQKGNPWQENRYLGIIKETQESEVIIAHKQEPEHPIVSVREHECSNEAVIKKIAQCSHENIVHIHEVFVDQNRVFFMYERMDVSIAEVQAGPYGHLQSYQIAAICQKVSKYLATAKIHLIRTPGSRWDPIYPSKP